MKGKRWTDGEEAMVDYLIDNDIPLRKFTNNRKYNDTILNIVVGRWDTQDPQDKIYKIADLIGRTPCAVRKRLEDKLISIGYNVSTGWR